MMDDKMNHDIDLLTPDAAGAGASVPLEEFGTPAEESEGEGGRGLEAVHDVQVKVRAVLGRARMPIGQLLRLKTGMVVELDRRVGEPVDVYVNDRLIARGEVVMIDNSLGVTLTEIIRPER
ncbi:flagellar motor switch protein FliN [Sphingomonas sp. ac-8]|uniref:flagellar motor switch protein FliN n=1 Tax=Sphingomonas sp. ac-8 TaxID=3242977 RepID=UPI003A8107CC